VLDLPWFFSNKFRTFLFLRQCEKDAMQSQKVASILRLPILDAATSQFKKRGNQSFFILAGGQSVNDLTEENFAQMRAGVSLGVNFWPIHDFVPSILSSESGHLEKAHPFLDERMRTKGMLTTPPSVFSLRTKWPVSADSLQNFPDELNRQRYVYGRANVVTRSERNLVSDLKKIVKAALDGQLPKGVLPDNGSSVVRMTFFALLQGFTQIVWVGVDQNSGPYFWTDPAATQDYERAAKLVPRSSGAPHSTSSAENRPFSNDIFLRALSSALKEQAQVNVYVGSSKSSLSDTIPVFNWN
jgi:hypothetical protein